MPIIHARRCADLRGYLTLGEGPIWDDVASRLLWVDIAEGLLYEGSLAGDRVEIRGRRAFGESVGAVALAHDGGLLVAGARRLHLIDAQGQDSGSVRLLDADRASRLNDAICDPAGRFLVGTLALDGRRGSERVFQVDAELGVVEIVSGLTLANGMGFSPDGATWYLVDSIPGAIHAFEYDVATGRLGDRSTIWSSDGLIPDGLTVDADGNLWVAFFGAGEVHCFTPTGEVVRRVTVPAPNTTCPAFVGPDLDRLLITTAREQLTAEQLSQWPDSGELFLAEPGVRGLPVDRWSGSTVGKTVDDSRTHEA